MEDPLLIEAEALPPVPPDATQAYLAEGEALIDVVNRAVAGRPDVALLLGGNPREMMAANHRHHHRFLTNVFLFGRFDLLAHTVPWVYRTYRAQGFSLDYFPVELKAWLDALAGHLTATHVQALRPAYDWMLRHHNELCRRSERPPPAPRGLHGQFAAARRRFAALLLEGDARGCGTEAAAMAGATLDGPSEFYLQVLQPALYEVGNRWERGEISVAEEHLATATATRLMAALYAGFVFPAATRGCAVVTTAANEYHEVGARMVADLLELDGWEVHYLGANTPAAALVSLLRRLRPEVVLLSVCLPFNLDHARDTIAMVRADPGLRHTGILVGGQAFAMVEGLWHDVGADAWAPDARAAVALARDRWGRKGLQ